MRALFVTLLVASCAAEAVAPDAATVPPDAGAVLADAAKVLVDAAEGLADAADVLPDAAALVDGGAPVPTSSVTKPDGVTPANYRCNHSFSDGPPGGNVDQHFHVGIMTNSDREGVRSGAVGARVELVDPRTGASIDPFILVTDAHGNVTLPLGGNVRIAWKIAEGFWGSPCDPCVTTYELNRLTSTATITTRIVEVDHFFGLTPGLGQGSAAKVIGTVVDCDGDPVKNATIEYAPPCAPGGQRPCQAYYAAGRPDVRATATDRDGRFLVFPAAEGPVTVRVRGGAEIIGETSFVAFDRSVIWTVATPLRN